MYSLTAVIFASPVKSCRRNVAAKWFVSTPQLVASAGYSSLVGSKRLQTKIRRPAKFQSDLVALWGEAKMRGRPQS